LGLNETEHTYSLIPLKCKGFSWSWKNHFAISKSNHTKQQWVVHASVGLTEMNC